MIEELSQAEVDKIRSDGDPDDVEVVASDEFIGKYILSGTSALVLLQEMKEDSRRYYIPLCVTAAFSLLALAVSVFDLLLTHWLR